MINRIQKTCRELLSISLVRRLALKFRLKFYSRIYGVKSLNPSKNSFEETVHHNLKSLMHGDDRMKSIMFPLFACECFNQEGHTLIIGPRNEHDLLLFTGLGGSWSKVRGVDLISYSPKIDLGDMHNLPYPDDYFDTVLCGWTLSYSTHPEVAIREITRVLKPGGMLAIGVEYSEMTIGDSRELQRSLDGEDYVLGFDSDGKRMLNSTDDIKKFLGPDYEFFFEHNAPDRKTHTRHGLVSRPSRVAIVARLN